MKYMLHPDLPQPPLRVRLFHAIWRSIVLFVAYYLAGFAFSILAVVLLYKIKMPGFYSWLFPRGEVVDVLSDAFQGLFTALFYYNNTRDLFAWIPMVAFVCYLAHFVFRPQNRIIRQILDFLPVMIASAVAALPLLLPEVLYYLREMAKGRVDLKSTILVSYLSFFVVCSVFFCLAYRCKRHDWGVFVINSMMPLLMACTVFMWLFLVTLFLLADGLDGLIYVVFILPISAPLLILLSAKYYVRDIRNWQISQARKMGLKEFAEEG